MQKIAYGLLAAGVLALAGCGSRGLPDENRVIAGPKLAVPPDFELRPPREGEDFATRVSAEKQAEIQTILGGAPVQHVNTQPTDTDSWLLQTVGGSSPAPASGDVVSGTVTVPLPMPTSGTAQ